MDIIISIPYNLASFNEKILGFDAYFWDTLSLEYRKILLIKNVDNLKEKPEGCALKSRVRIEDQYNDLMEISKFQKALPETRRGGLPLPILRIASLIIPYRIAEMAWSSHVDSMVLEEIRITSNIASQILSLGSWKPLHVTRWLVVIVGRNGVNERTLDYLRSVDTGFSLALREAIMKCTSG